MAKLKRQSKECFGCGEPFITYRHYDYCQDCAVNNNRYLSKSNCAECDGSGKLKFPRQKPRPCKLCALTKKTMPNFKNNQKLTAEEQFWKEVEKKAKDLIANLVEKVLPIDATPQNFDLEKDADYRVLIRDDLPRSYYESEEYQTKITNHRWTEEEVEYVAQEVTVYYFDLVAQSLARRLNTYPAFENTKLRQLESK